MREENVEVGRRAVEAFNRRDVEAFAAILSPDAELVPMRAALEGTSYRGREGAARFFADTDEIWDSISVELDADPVQVDDGVVYADGRVRGRGRDSGIDVEMELAWVLRFRDGLITSFRTCTDRAEAREDAGLAPPSVIIRAYEALSRCDLDAWLDTTSPDVELHEVAEVPDSRVYRGRGEAREWAEAMLQLVDEWRWTPEEVLLSHGDTVVVRACVTGRSQTGVPLDVEVFHVFETRDDKLTSMRGFFSRARAIDAAATDP